MLQLDRIPDLLYLVDQAADVAVRDVGNLFQYQILHFGTLEFLEDQIRLGVDSDVVPSTKEGVSQSL